MFENDVEFKSYKNKSFSKVNEFDFYWLLFQGLQRSQWPCTRCFKDLIKILMASIWQVYGRRVW